MAVYEHPGEKILKNVDNRSHLPSPTRKSTGRKGQKRKKNAFSMRAHSRKKWRAALGLTRALQAYQTDHIYARSRVQSSVECRAARIGSRVIIEASFEFISGSNRATHMWRRFQQLPAGKYRRVAHSQQSPNKPLICCSSGSFLG